MHDKLRKIREERNEDGFTLIELLVVVVIIGILIAIAIPLYLNYQRGAHDKSAQSDLRSAISTLQQCFTENNESYPTTALADVTGNQTLNCNGTNEQINLSSQTHFSYAPDATGSSYVISAWNTGGRHNTSGNAYTYNSNNGGSIQ